jgi:hypothetical protein
MAPLREQVEVVLGDDAPVAIGVVGLRDMAAAERRARVMALAPLA